MNKEKILADFRTHLEFHKILRGRGYRIEDTDLIAILEQILNECECEGCKYWEAVAHEMAGHPLPEPQEEE